MKQYEQNSDVAVPKIVANKNESRKERARIEELEEKVKEHVAEIRRLRKDLNRLNIVVDSVVAKIKS